ncbi:iron-containing redox enzyme family protein [Euzebya rosea]|uniref:iron-containing redox enzyme family protein n=1 Tax=Euzebya rosea TaxID=2052804 RepID=UPI00196AC8D0|nr:iron-containing redox enzyme family protein [Euzebya rosea]
MTTATSPARPTIIDQGRPSPLPEPRGEASQALLKQLQERPGAMADLPLPTDDPLTGEDAPLALYLCYELHYRGLEGIDDTWEWDPALLAHRAQLERAFEERVRDEVGRLPAGFDLADELWALAPQEPDPEMLAVRMATEGTWAQLVELTVQRSAYQRKEADPHTWALPRLAGDPKARLVHIQADEYGEGVTADMHAGLFGMSMQRMGLDPTYGAYLDHIPGVTLSTVNLISLFGLHRRHRGALIGHLSGFEMASVIPMTQYARALRRLGADDWTCLFYDTHVVADASHQFEALEMAESLVDQDPTLAPDVLFGARALAAVEGRFSSHIRAAFDAGRTSLRREVDMPPQPANGDR